MQPTPQRILIVKPSALGDVVTALPVLRGLRRTFPQARISWLVNTSCAPILQGQGSLDEILLFERRLLGGLWRSAAALKALLALRARLRAGQFDWVIDLQGLFRSGFLAASTRAPLRAGFADAREGATFFYNRRIQVSASHTVDRNIELARQLDVDARPEDMTLEVAEAARQFADGFCRQHGLTRGGFLVAVPSTRWRTKAYPGRHWRSVVATLAGESRIVLAGTKDDAPAAAAMAEGLAPAVINQVGQTNIQQMVGLIAASGGVICNDSAAKFIAPAVGVDCVTLIGPTRVANTGPYGRGHAILSPVPCQGCLRRACRHITCMELIEPARVVEAARRMMAVTRR